MIGTSHRREQNETGAIPTHGFWTHVVVSDSALSDERSRSFSLDCESNLFPIDGTRRECRRDAPRQYSSLTVSPVRSIDRRSTRLRRLAARLPARRENIQHGHGFTPHRRPAEERPAYTRHRARRLLSDCSVDVLHPDIHAHGLRSCPCWNSAGPSAVRPLLSHPFLHCTERVRIGHERSHCQRRRVPYDITSVGT